MEERSRFELGMVKSDEVFYQLPQRKKAAVTPAPATPTDTAKPDAAAAPSKENQ